MLQLKYVSASLGVLSYRRVDGDSYDPAILWCRLPCYLLATRLILVHGRLLHNSVSYVNQALYIRDDIMGDSNAKQETSAAMKPKCRSWAFEATFVSSIHPVLVTECNDAATAYIQNMINMNVVCGLDFSPWPYHPFDLN